ncbi:hypothetical protein ACWEQL_11325 [Kitasatospora sp. NPDC004240]
MLTAAISFALTAGGLAVAGLRAYRRRYRSAVRWFAVALLPAGLYLSGLFPLARTIAEAFGDWATGLVFDPAVWTGLAMLAVSTTLLLVVRRVDRRRAVDGAAGPAEATGAAARPAVAATPERPAGQAAARPKARKKQDAELGEFADVEEILRRRGI